VPFKNWLRDSGQLSALVQETLGSEEFLGRGLFRRESIARLLEEHRQRRHNHSHRIWALFILEQWFRQHFPSASAANLALPADRAA
jgi:asparagine synthase (glutamine-hydrolysing)